MTGDDFDELLEDRQLLNRADAVAALRIVSPVGLTEQDGRILDEAEFTAEPERSAQAAAAAPARTAQLIKTALTVDQVAAALGVSQSRIHQRRAQHGLWAIEVDGRWLFPAMQFQGNLPAGGVWRQIRGLDQVLKALPHDLHPVSVAGFLSTPHPNLLLKDRQTAPLEWLGSGGDVVAVLDLVAAAHWVS